MSTSENTGPTPKRRNVTPLKTMKNLRVFVAKTLRELKEYGEPGDPNRARCLIYGAKVLSEIISGSDLEERIARLEGKKPEAEAVQ